jgi:oligopeptide transport system substrate-binding protein
MRPGKKITYGFLPALLCLFAILLAACGGTTTTPPGSSGPTKAPANKQIYVFPDEGVSDIATFDPGLSTDLSSINAIDLVFTGLVQLDDNLKVQPQLAASYSLGSDGLTWTFHLRPNLKFSDGTALTSADVAYSIDRALQPAEKSGVGPIYLALIKDSDKLVAGKIKTIIGDSVMTPDPSTVVLVANKKASYFLDALTYSCSYVVEKSLIDKYGNIKFTDHLTEGGGDGPFKVASYTHGQNIIFVPNPNYYGPIPQLAKVVYPFYKDVDTTYKAYQVNQVDAATIPAAQLAAARKLTNEYHQVPQLWISYYAMNYLVKPFDNIKIRQAFYLAINKDLIVQTVWKNSLIATNHIVPKGMPGYTPNLTGPGGVASTAGDPTKAKALFTAGLQEEGMTLATLPPIRLTYSSGNKDEDNEVAAMQQMWQNTLGVSVKADPIDFNHLLSEITAATNNPKGLQFWGIGWIADYPDPQDWTTLQFDKGVPNNNMNYGQNNTSDAAQQQAVQQQLEAADINPDQNARLQSYMQAEQQLINDVAWLPMEQVTNNFLRKPCLVGVIDNPQLLTPPNDWGAVYKSTATPCADTSSFQ